METVIEAIGIKKYFPVKKGFQTDYLRAVDDVTLSIKRGETLGLVGESGCGKSTLGRTLLMLTEPTAGVIKLCNEDLTKISKSELRKKRNQFQMIFQDPYASLNPRHTVRKILEEPMIIHNLRASKKERLEYMHELMESVGIDPYYINKKPGEFSGGQRQRIGIARALSMNPKLIVADEPVSALDVSIQSQVLNLMIELKKKYGFACLFISHNLSVVKYISDRIAVMYLGKIVELTDKERIYSDCLHPYTKALISAIPIPDPHLVRPKTILKGDLPNAFNPPSGCAFHTRCPEATDICREKTPQLIEATPGHYIACHLYHKV
ncbi:MAG: ABC transporter ATP-binding protein [Acetivibrionales bacterium]